MSTSGYERVKRTVLEAQEKSGEARAAFLYDVEEVDPALAEEVRALLEHEDGPLPEMSGTWIASLLSPESPALEKLGPYPIEVELGRGGAGVVYLARDPVLGRQIALKVLPPEVARRPVRLERFRKEARLLASINHPNIATIHSLEAEHDPPYLSLEYVDGETLARQLVRGRLSLDDSMRVAQQIARALEAAHVGGVVHRDLKPANVMVTPAGMVKVVDFGLAVGTRLEGDGDVQSSQTTAMVVEGTPGYMSPEQIQGKTIDRGTDVWAFGCVFFECLAGQSAFGSGSLLERSTRALEADLDWQRVPDSVPSSLRELLRHCLTPDPERRLGSMTAAREAIEEVIFRRKMSRARAEPTSIRIAPPHNLPPTVDSFVGRQRELENLASRLTGHRIVTLTGAGGTGKTRLALEAARRSAEAFEDGVWFVDFAPLENPSAVVEETVRAMGARADGSKDAVELLKAFTSGKRMLLVLDNCEHVREAAAELIGHLIQSSAHLSVLATSREVLRVRGEAPMSVPPLGVEDGPGSDEGRGSEAVQLFLDRATTADPGLEAAVIDLSAVVKICRRLDGIPLAIELAAARVRALSVHEIAERLADRFALIGSGSMDDLGTEPSGDAAAKPPDSERSTTSSRHRSLHALIDWTFQQLSPPEQTIFRRLSAFRGGWTLVGAEAVCAGDGVQPWEFLDAFIQLVEKSLVYRDVEGESIAGRSRYRMFETIRAFAFDRLAEHGEQEAATGQHLAYFLSQAEQAQKEITGVEQANWVKRIDADYANYRHALSISLHGGRGLESGLKMAAALGEYWQIRGYYQEAAEMYRAALDRPESRGDSYLRARLLAWAGNVALAQGRYGDARGYHEEGVTECERDGNQRGLGGAINSLGVIAWRRGDVRGAREHYERAAGIWRDLGDERLSGVTLNNLGVLDMETGDYASARTHYEHSLRIQEKLGNRHAEAVLRANIGLAAMQLGEHDDARAAFESSLEIRREVGDRAGIAHSLNGLGSTLERQGELDAARTLFEESLALYEEVGDHAAASVPLINLGFIGLHQDDTVEAGTRFRRAQELAGEAGDTANEARAVAGLGMVALADGRQSEAATLLLQGLEGLYAVEDRWGVTLVLEHIGPFFEQVGKPVQAAHILGFLEGERESLRAPRTALQQRDHNRFLSTLSQRLPSDVLSHERQAGRDMTLDEVIVLARSMEVEEP